MGGGKGGGGGGWSVWAGRRCEPLPRGACCATCSQARGRAALGGWGLLEYRLVVQSVVREVGVGVGVFGLVGDANPFQARLLVETWWVTAEADWEILCMTHSLVVHDRVCAA